MSRISQEDLDKIYRPERDGEIPDVAFDVKKDVPQGFSGDANIEAEVEGFE